MTRCNYTETTLMLETDLVEDGRAVRLETVMFRPEGDGPFPTLIFNHGSTGDGTDLEVGKMTFNHWPVSDFFARRGWLVALPHRRGRGKSDGLYDEGFQADRARGYTDEIAVTLAGADRALADVEAAIAALTRPYPEIDRDRRLIGGVSRGGILSTVYAGRHPSEVRGVLNFVGGWLGGHSPNVEEVNQGLFREGAAFPGDTLWIYGEADPFYSLEHCRRNFAAFQAAGGTGSFVAYGDVPENGHEIWMYPARWKDEVTDYLSRLGPDLPSMLS